MVKVYDMASGQLLTDSSRAAYHAVQDEAFAWSAPRAAAEAPAAAQRDRRDVPELALQLLEVR